MRLRLCVIAILILFSACSHLNKLSLYNLSNQYDNSGYTDLYAVAFHQEGQSSIVHASVLMEDMVIAHDDHSNRNYRKARLRYELFETYESKQILDSAQIMITDSSLLVGDTIVMINIQYPEKKKYILKLELTDMNRVDAVDYFLFLDNTSSASAENYLLKDADGDIMFSNVLSDEDIFYLECSDKSSRQLFVRYYDREYPLALPPFLEETETNFDYKADSVFILPVQDGKTSLISLPDKGFYHFQSDSNRRGGYTVFRFKRGYPEIITTEQMLQPLRYITTMDEFDEMRNAVDIKLAIDNFWLNNAGNPSRARSMIQKYYGRVVDANKYFTSYHEGWKTDRGLIFLIYGPPRIVYRGKNMEEWLYGEKGNKNSIRFQFVKVVNPFSENDYSLIKSPAYREKWYNIVNTWRR